MAVQTESPMAASNVQAKQDFWYSYFSFYDRLNDAVPYRQMIEYHLNGLRPGPGDLILDAGTGSGNVSVELIRAGAKVLGIDFCLPALDICRAKAPSGEFQFGDLSRPLEFETGRFDKISCCSVLQFIQRPAQELAMREFFRVLKPGGLVTITVFVNGFDSMKVYWASLREHRKDHTFAQTVFHAMRYSWDTSRILHYVRKIRLLHEAGEYQYFSVPELVTMAANAGFEVLESGLTFADQASAVVARKPAAS